MPEERDPDDDAVKSRDARAVDPAGPTDADGPDGARVMPLVEHEEGGGDLPRERNAEPEIDVASPHDAEKIETEYQKEND